MLETWKSIACMSTEIERKFLVSGDGWRGLAPGTIYRQGYMPTQNGITVRVRVIGSQGYLTVKGRTTGISRLEFEYPIPIADAWEMLDNFCAKPLIEKTRYQIKYGDIIWEVDEFHGDNQGLIIAEVELATENQIITIPEWIGAEVSHEPKYFNANLAKHPYSRW
ncbi:CYTH domain-containing protein [[Phormidium] sp. ETS-05]|uniref:CYTH domain-containing protein n=1 Tax=[Phormidium] sp. ETS-05 TaxID=222819 RepID=UPI0031FEBCE5